jgi:aspartyl-tRNA(Asn)/glutamyl-tRNA(Gln) amidotransferase subunit A
MKQEDLFSPLSSIKEISEKIRNGDLSPVDLVKTCLHSIKKMNPILNAFITVIDEQTVYEQAKIYEKEIKQGNYRGPLHGIPFSIKDIFYAKGVRCTAGSKILANYIPKEESTVVTKAKNAGAILIGTNNLNEFASGITGINPFYGSSKNPWDISRISGGSSGGSAVAVATGMVFFSLGTDTGGSARVPASLCGIVGFKPTYGFISKHNVFPLSPSLDHVGCITRCVWDAAAVLECIADMVILDNTMEHNRAFSYTKIIGKKRNKKYMIGIPQEYFFDFINPEVGQLYRNFIESVSNNAVIRIKKIHLHNTAKYFTSWRDVRLAESSEVHSEWLKTRPLDYSTDVRNLLLEGTKISAVDYIKSLGFVKEIRGDFLSILRDGVDALIVPTTIIPAPRFEEDIIGVGGGVALTTREALLRNTIIFNSIGLPTVSIPVGFTNDGLPIGVQIIGAPYDEGLILSIAYDCEQQLNNAKKKSIPPIWKDKIDGYME